MLRNGDWGNLALRCEEAKYLKERQIEKLTQTATSSQNNYRDPFERSEEERKETVLGLARFKVSKELMEQALAIARQFNFSISQLGIGDKQQGTEQIA